jgi:hypothetical protein
MATWWGAPQSGRRASRAQSSALRQCGLDNAHHPCRSSGAVLPAGLLPPSSVLAPVCPSVLKVCLCMLSRARRVCCAQGAVAAGALQRRYRQSRSFAGDHRELVVFSDLKSTAASDTGGLLKLIKLARTAVCSSARRASEARRCSRVTPDQRNTNKACCLGWLSDQAHGTLIGA